MNALLDELKIPPDGLAMSCLRAPILEFVTSSMADHPTSDELAGQDK